MPRPNIALFISLALLFFVVPTSSWALTGGTASAPSCDQNSQVVQDDAKNMANVMVAKRNAVYGVHNQLAKIQTDLFSCLDGIDLGFSLGPLFHNPLGVIEAALEAAFWMMIDALLDSICHTIVNAVNSVVNQIVSSVESLANFACIPMPNLGLNLNANLNLPHVPCNGTPLIPGSAIITQTPASSGTSSLRMWGRTSQ